LNAFLGAFLSLYDCAVYTAFLPQLLRTNVISSNTVRSTVPPVIPSDLTLLSYESFFCRATHFLAGPLLRGGHAWALYRALLFVVAVTPAYLPAFDADLHFDSFPPLHATRRPPCPYWPVFPLFSLTRQIGRCRASFFNILVLCLLP